MTRCESGVSQSQSEFHSYALTRTPRYTHDVRTAMLLCSFSVVLLSCDSANSCDSVRSLRIVAPEDGTSVMGSELTVTVEACAFDRDEVVRVLLLEPVEADYGFITVFDEPIVSTTVPTLPGTMRLVATDADDMLRSDVVSVEASP